MSNEGRIGWHTRFECAVRVGQFSLDGKNLISAFVRGLDVSGRKFCARGDIDDTAGEDSSGEGVNGDIDPLSQAHPTNVRLRYVNDKLHRIQIGKTEQCAARHHYLPSVDQLLQHNSLSGRPQHHFISLNEKCLSCSLGATHLRLSYSDLCARCTLFHQSQLSLCPVPRGTCSPQELLSLDYLSLCSFDLCTCTIYYRLGSSQVF